MGQEFIQTTMELDVNGDLIPYEVEGWVCAHTENYGEDADGNRGEKRTFIDEVYNIVVIGENGPVELSKSGMEKAEQAIVDAFYDKN